MFIFVGLEVLFSYHHDVDARVDDCSVVDGIMRGRREIVLPYWSYHNLDDDIKVGNLVKICDGCHCAYVRVTGGKRTNDGSGLLIQFTFDKYHWYLDTYND